MCNCNWETIEEFFSPGEFEKFSNWISSQLEEEIIEQVSVENTYAGEYFEEKWFKCKESGQVWRLVSPQAPFLGYWGAV